MRYIIAIAIVLCAAALAGCTAMGARQVIEAQQAGRAAGAGASLAGPNNSAESSTQVAERTIEFHAPSVAYALPAPTVPVIDMAAPAPSAPGFVRPAAPAPAPARITERVQTSLGAHQDASGIIKAATAMLGPVRLCGLVALLLGVGGMLHSAGNRETGYPACWLLTAGVGALLLLTNSWLLLIAAAIPAGLYFAQKLNLLRLPGT